jgi:hypothetical protein
MIEESGLFDDPLIESLRPISENAAIGSRRIGETQE